MENKIKITSFEDGILVKISGELDSLKVMTYREKIHREMIDNSPRLIAWDLKDITLIDSSGIGLVLGRFNELEKIQGYMGFIALNRYVKRIIEISGLFQIIKEYRNLREFVEEGKLHL